LLFDIHSNRSGFPDLIQFFPNSPNGKNYRLIEVKGPGDRLQDNQQRWLEYFSAHDIPAEVWYVRWQ
jgi:VRR-NUC domain